MTQKSFIQYLLDIGCEVSQDNRGEFYRVRNREGNRPWSKTTMPMSDKYGNMKMATICLICHHLNVLKPHEVREYDEQFFEPVIVKNHLLKPLVN